MSSYEYNKYNALFEETPDASEGSEFLREPAKWIIENLRDEHKVLWLRAKTANPHWSREDLLAYALVGIDYAAAFLSDNLENIASDRLSLMCAVTVRPIGTPDVSCVKHIETAVPEGGACPDCIAHMLTMRPDDMSEEDAMTHINQLVASSIMAHEMSPGELIH